MYTPISAERDKGLITLRISSCFPTTVIDTNYSSELEVDFNLWFMFTLIDTLRIFVYPLRFRLCDDGKGFQATLVDWVFWVKGSFVLLHKIWGFFIPNKSKEYSNIGFY